MIRESKGGPWAHRVGLLAIFGVATAASACLNFGAFSCDDNGDCDAEAMGLCQPVGYCSYPDADCLNSGHRYEDSAGDGLGGQCVGEDVAGSGTEQTSAEDTDTPLNTSGDTTADTTVGVDPTDTSDDDPTTGGDCGAGGQECCPADQCDPGLMCSEGMCGCVEFVEVGDRHSCAVKFDGSLWCWGANEVGQLTEGDPGPVLTPMQIEGFGPGAEVLSLSARNHTCAIRTGNVASCWGDNSNQKIDFGSVLEIITTPVDATWANPAVVVGTGGNHTCVGRQNGLPVPVVCWGGNDSGQTTGPDLMPGPHDVSLGGGIISGAIALGQSHSCVVATTGELFCWGSNAFGQLGIPVMKPAMTSTVQLIPIVGNVATVVAGAQHTCAMSGTEVVCWGRNTLGQVGNGTMVDTATPTTVIFPPGAGTVQSIVAADNHTCAVMASGALYCWGGNEEGELRFEVDKNGIDGFSLQPRQSALGIDITQVATGLIHSCALSTTGQVVCWGANGDGQIGDGTQTDAQEPTAVDLECP